MFFNVSLVYKLINDEWLYDYTYQVVPYISQMQAQLSQVLESKLIANSTIPT
jgi:hypothetical protein